MAAAKRKQDEKYLKIIREMASLTHNRQCFDCGQRGPTYVNMTIGSYVCTACSGVLRGINPPQRVKSISMTSFSADDIEFLKCHGNEYCRKVWLGLYDARMAPELNSKDEHKVKDFMAQKYEKKRWYVAPTEEMKEEAKKMNEPQKPPETKPLRHLLGAGAPRLVVQPGQLTKPAVSQPQTSPAAVPVPFSSPTQQTHQPQQQMPSSQGSATADLLGELGGDPFGSTATPASKAGGFANFGDFSGQPAAGFPATNNPTNFLQPIGTQASPVPSSNPLTSTSQQQNLDSNRYSALGDLFSDNIMPAEISAPAPSAAAGINWSNPAGGGVSGGAINWGGGGGVAGSSNTGGAMEWNSSGSNSFGASGMSSSTGTTSTTNTSMFSGTGTAPAGNPFGTSTSSAQGQSQFGVGASGNVSNPFMAAPGQPNQMFGQQAQAPQQQQQQQEPQQQQPFGGFGQFNNAPSGQAGFGGVNTSSGGAGFRGVSSTGQGFGGSSQGFGGFGNAAPATQPGQFGMQNGGTSSAMFGPTQQQQPQQVSGWGGQQPASQAAFGQPSAYGNSMNLAQGQMGSFNQASQPQASAGLWQTQANNMSMAGAGMVGLATAQFKQQPQHQMQWGQPTQPAGGAAGNPFMNAGAQQMIPPKSNSTNPFL